MHNNVKLLLPSFLVVVIISSGCVNIDPQALAIANPMIKEFFDDHPNAEIVVTRLSKEQVASYVDDIRSECGNPDLQAKDMYRVTIDDPDSDLRSVVWIGL